jgi:hypothetical protein
MDTTTDGIAFQAHTAWSGDKTRRLDEVMYRESFDPRFDIQRYHAYIIDEFKTPR